MLLSQLCTDFENMTSVQCSLAQDEWLADLGCDLHIYRVNISLLKGLFTPPPPKKKIKKYIFVLLPAVMFIHLGY